ncbi:MAG: hypothetical protein HYY61_01640 [Deltaproteobacteria bacterium]|nr:hypothetical protein [Deltaproteobacteria bacterium]
MCLSFQKYVFLGILLFSWPSLAAIETVESQPQEPFLTSFYNFSKAGLTTHKGIAYLWVQTKAPEDWPARDCDHELDRIHCRTETGYFALPSDAVIFDGEKRLKYIRNGRTLTIAKLEGFPFFKTWEMENNIHITVGDYLESATLVISDLEE